MLLARNQSVAALIAVGCLTCTLSHAQPAVLTTEADSQSAEGRPTSPTDLGLVESARRDLVQIDVTVRGPADEIDRMTRGDFSLFLDGDPISDFSVDRVCPGIAESDVVAPDRPATASTPTPAPSSGSYLFYFDQHHLTPEGRQRSIDLARRLIPELIRGGSRGLLVSSGTTTQVFVKWTESATELLSGLERLEHDPEQWDSYPALEEVRVAQLYGDARSQYEMGQGLDSLLAGHEAAAAAAAAAAENLVRSLPISGGAGDFGGLRAARLKQQLISKIRNRGRSMVQEVEGLRAANADGTRMAVKMKALTYQKEERFHAQKALARFSMALSRLADVAAPKSVLYFADILRANPGRHYLSAFSDGECTGPSDPLCDVDADSIPAYQAAIDEAAKYGVRFYTVQGRGLVLETAGSVANRRFTTAFGNRSPLVNTRRFADAKNALAGWAAETGGEAFLNGAAAKKILRRIREDLACVFLLNFDAGRLPRDRPLSVRVESRRGGIEVGTRPRLIIQSDTSRRQARLTAAYLEPEGGSTDSRLAVSVIPLGLVRDRFASLVQVTLPARSLDVDWDVGFVVVARDTMGSKVTRRLSSKNVKIPLVFESQLEFSPGPYELIVVARDRVHDRVYSVRAEGGWPDLKSGEAQIGPVTILQPAEAVFVRGAATRLRGSRAVSEGEWLRPELPTAIVGIACRPGGRSGRQIRIDRKVVGTSVAEFDALELETSERCYLIRDLVPPRVLASGRFDYEIELRSRGEVIERHVHTFTAVSHDFELARGDGKSTNPD